MSGDALHAILDAAGGSLVRVGRVIGEPRLLATIGGRLGWSLASVPPPLATAASQLGGLAAALDVARRDPEAPGPWLDVATAIAGAARAIEALETASFGGPLDALDFGRVFARQILTWAVIEELQASHPRWLGLARALGAVRSRRVEAAADRPAFIDESFAIPAFDELLTSPSTLLRAAWGWGDPAFDGHGLLDELAAMFGTYGISAGWTTAPPSPRELADGPPGSIRWHMVARLIRAQTPAGSFELGLRFVPWSASPTEPSIAIVPYLEGAAAVALALGGGVTLSVDGVAGTGGRGILVSPSSIDVVDDALGTGGVAGALGVTLERKLDAPIDLPIGGLARIRFGGWRLRAGAVAGESTASDLFVEASLIDSQIGFGGGDSGLLGDALASAMIPVPLMVGLSARRGVYLGATGLTQTLGGSIGLGPVELRDVTLSLAAGEDGLAARATATARVQLGPVAIALRGLGVALAADVPGRGGNLGPIDLAIRPVTPTGAAVSIDTALVTGGGVLEHVAGRDYRGALTVDVLGIRVTAMGVVDDTPQSRGSFVAIAGARFPGLQLGWGFTLDGIGGVIAVHRRIDVERIRRDLARGSAAALLDLDIPAADLLSRIDALAAAFPTAHGRHVVGPTFQIGWGTPRILRADLAVLLELPSPVRLILLGALQAGLPSLDHRIVDLRLDLLGVLDLERRTIAIDASLHDSSLAGYPLTGDMALRLGFGSAPHFLLSIGGFHPHFTPPPGFPTLRRLALTAGDNPQLRLSAYLALTTNTAQVGARADLRAHGGGFSISAHVAFDALFEFVPFHFEVELAAGASISWHGHKLLGVDLDVLLTGPRPWHAKGHATFGILWWDVSVGFDTTWGDARPAALPPPPDLAAVLRAALARPDAWVSVLPPGERGWIVVAERDDGTIRVHPLATLAIRERAVPLDHDITAFGSVPLPARQRFSIQSVRVGASTVAPTPIDDVFAPGQFTRLASDERLAAPSFERFRAGVELGTAAVAVGSDARTAMTVDTIAIDPLAPVDRPRPPIVLPSTTATHATAVRPTRPRRFPPAFAARVRDLRFTLASTEDLAITAEAAAIGAGHTTYAGLREALRRERATSGRGARLQIVPRIETANHRARIVVVREDENLRNIDFVDTVTGRAMTRAELVDAIDAGEYPDYGVRLMHGVRTPVSRPNANTDDNLG